MIFQVVQFGLRSKYLFLFYKLLIDLV